MLSEEKKLIDYVRSECKEHGIRFVLSNHQAVNTGERCRASGYFDETSLVVAKKSSKWVQTLAHEYCHMCQWLEGEPKYTAKTEDGRCPCIVFLEWVNGIHDDKNLAFDAMKKVIEMERDCEMRTEKLLQEYGLLQCQNEINTFRVRANAYLYSHWVSFQEKRWPKARWSTLIDPEMMPKTFRCKPHEKCSARIYQHVSKIM